MKNDRYYIFKQKLFLQVILICLLTLLGLFLLSSFLTGKLGQFVTSFLQVFFRMDYEEAFNFYHFNIRAKKFIFIFIAGIAIVLLMFKILISFMTKYFDEISQGLDILLDESPEKIILSDEMHFLETRLNQGKDILKKRNIEIEEAEDKKNDLIMYLAHDLKTPLTSIIGYLHLLKDLKNIGEDDQYKYIDLILDKSNHLENLINEIFEITKLNSNSLSLNKEILDLNLMLEQVVEDFYPSLKEKGKSINLNLKPNIKIEGDLEKLSRSFKNLIKNAISYSRQNSIIDISSKSIGSKIYISFANPVNNFPDDPNKLFDKFYRTDKSRSSKTGGSGLGLVITKEIILLHGGDIFVRKEDGQIIFTIVLEKYL